MNSNLEKAIKVDIGYSDNTRKVCSNCYNSFIGYTESKHTPTAVDSCRGVYVHPIKISPTGYCKHWK